MRAGIEAFHSMKTGKLFLNGNFMAVKLDMMKAYNWVEWSYLEWMLQKMHFPLHWVHSIIKCVTLVLFRILISLRGDLCQ